MSRFGPKTIIAALLALAAACGGGEATDPRCTLPSAPDTVRAEEGAVLLVWEFPAAPVYREHLLPDDSAYQAYRARIRADGAALRRPVADRPEVRSEDVADLWRAEDHNHELAQSGEVGSIEPITCLDALFFAYQNARVPQLERPTEFLVSVMRREHGGQPEMAAIFGAGDELFPPKSVYGLDVVDDYRARGWSYAYALHNHTLQRNGDRAPGPGARRTEYCSPEAPPSDPLRSSWRHP